MYPNSGKNGHFYLEKIKRAFKEGPIFVSLKAVSIKPFILTHRCVYANLPTKCTALCI